MPVASAGTIRVLRKEEKKIFWKQPGRLANGMQTARDPALPICLKESHTNGTAARARYRRDDCQQLGIEAKLKSVVCKLSREQHAL